MSHSTGARASFAVETANGVGEDEWDKLVSNVQGPLRHGFIEVWRQNVQLQGLRSQPLVVQQDGTVVAAAHAYLYDLDMASGIDARLGHVVGSIRKVWPRALLSRVFEIGSPTPIVNPFLALGEPSEEAIDTLVRSAQQRARESGAGMLIVQNFESAAYRDSIARVLGRHRFARIPIPPTVVLQLPYTSFDDYLGAMRAQYRRRAKKVLEQSKHLEPEVLHDFADIAPELARLWRLVWERAKELKREVFPAEFFAAASELDYVTVLALRRRDGTIASYALLLEDRPWLHFLYTGFEREAGEQEGAYFRLIYEIARYAIDNGFPTVNLGMTTIEPKLDAGGTVVPLSAWIRARHDAMHEIGVRLQRGPLAPKPVPPRQVFKA